MSSTSSPAASSSSSSAPAPTSELAQLKSSLRAHNASFDTLLRTIPAQYYIRNETEQDKTPAVPLTKSQKKAAKKKSQEASVKLAKSEALRKAKLARYDPDAPKTIPEIQKAALEAAKGKARADAEDSGDSQWEDDSEEGGDDDDEEEDSANDTDFVDDDDEGDDDELSGLPLMGKRDADAPAPTITELRLKLQRRIADIQAHKRGGAAGTDGEVGSPAPEESARSKEELLEERRKQRGLVRDNRRRKRKAERREEKLSGEKKERVASNGRKGGGKANAPPKEPREERGFGFEDEDRPRKKTKAASPEPTQAVVVAPPVAVAKPKPAPAAAAPANPMADINFSTLDFTTSTLLNANTGKGSAKLTAAGKKNRHALPKDANAALEILEKRKERMEKLDPEQREKKEDKERWEKVELKASGEKVRDDEKRLKKMAKRQEKIKSKSAKNWAARKETVSNNINAKIEKRNNNLAARVKQAKDKKAGIKAVNKGTHKTKSKSHAGRVKTGGGRPGFEGASRKK